MPVPGAASLSAIIIVATQSRRLSSPGVTVTVTGGPPVPRLSRSRRGAQSESLAALSHVTEYRHSDRRDLPLVTVGLRQALLQRLLDRRRLAGVT